MQKPGKQVRKLAWAIEDYLDLQGYWAERIIIIQNALDAARKSKSRYDEGAFLNFLGLAYAALGETRKAIELHEKLLPARSVTDKAKVVFCAT